MGYRSDVVIVTELKNKDLIKAIEEGQGQYHSRKQMFIKTYDGEITEIIKYEFDDVKWYPNFVYVADIMGCINVIEDKESYGIILIGEEIQDIEVQGFPYRLGVVLNRSIDFIAEEIDPHQEKFTEYVKGEDIKFKNDYHESVNHSGEM
tara:strand:+ start:169 stop:615 length:447 start_codon:yes stop_codon:yes gene_type:complete